MSVSFFAYTPYDRLAPAHSSVRALDGHSWSMLLALSIVGIFVLPSPWNVVAVCVAAVIEVGELWAWRRFLSRYRVRGGAEGMIGERGEAIAECAPRGRVKVRGEIWEAESSGPPIAPGAGVRVEAVEGLVLRVSPAGDPP